MNRFKREMKPILCRLHKKRKKRKYSYIGRAWQIWDDFFGGRLRVPSRYPANPEALVETVDQSLRSKGYYKSPSLSIEQLCDYMHTNRTYLSRALQQVKQQQFCTYINTFRVEEAQRLLAEGAYRDLDYESIAYASGFGNTRTFYRVFVKISGMTPRRYAAAVRQVRQMEK